MTDRAKYKVPVQSLIDHIKTAVDVDDWAKEMAEDLLKRHEEKPIAHKENRMTGLPVAICPECSRFERQFHMECPGDETRFCPWCGQAVKWDD